MRRGDAADGERERIGRVLFSPLSPLGQLGDLPIYWNCHEERLFSLDCLDEDAPRIGGKGYETMPPGERLDIMPFVQNPIADSLEEMLRGIKEMTEEEYERVFDLDDED